MVDKIGFLSFGAWGPGNPGMATSAAEAYTQAVDLAVAAEEVGFDGAYFRVHHFARQASAPFPLLAAAGARTNRIELGTAVIDMRYENPTAMAENAAIADLIAAGRLELGVSRGSPEPALNGPELFGNPLTDRNELHEDARARMAEFRRLVSGGPAAKANPFEGGTGPGSMRPTGGAPSRPILPVQPQSPGLGSRLWWGAGSRETAKWTGEQGYHLMSSTLLLEDAGIPFDEFQAQQIEVYREAYKASGRKTGGRVSVSRSVMPLITDTDRAYFGFNQDRDQVGVIDQTIARFGRSYTGEPDVVAAELAADVAVQEADTLLVTIPSQLGVEYNRHLMDSIVKYVAPSLGWTRKG